MHLHHDPLVGVPLNPKRFDYLQAATWNSTIQQRWSATLDALYGVLELTKRQRNTVSYFATKELQKRGLLHVHALVRCKLPQGVGARDIRDALVGVLVSNMTWGEHCDVQILDPADERELHQKAAYSAKYMTKDMCSNLPKRGTALRRHYARISKYGIELLGDKKKATPRIRARVADQLGHRGSMYSRSHSWGLTLKAIRQERLAFVREQHAPRKIAWTGMAGYRTDEAEERCKKLRDAVLPHEPSHESMYAIAADVGEVFTDGRMPVDDLPF